MDMAVKVKIPSPLRQAVGGQSELEVNASNVVGVLEELDRHFPGFRARLVDEKGNLRRFITFYINGEDIRLKEGLATPLNDGDEVLILPAVAGG